MVCGWFRVLQLTIFYVDSKSFSLPNWLSLYDLINPRMVDSGMSYFFATGQFPLAIAHFPMADLI